MTNIRELLARQYALEDESRALGADRYRSLAKTREDVLQKASQTIRVQMQSKAASAYDDQLTVDAHDGKPLDYEGC